MEIRTLALRVNAKLGTLSFSEGIQLPRVHDKLGGSQQTLQRRLGRIGRILLEGLLQIALEQSVGAIILVRVMEVGQDLFEFAELLDRDCLSHRFVQILPLVVSAYEVVKCSKRVALPESLKDEGDLPTHLPVGDRHAFHDFGGHESQADRHDGLRVR